MPPQQPPLTPSRVEDVQVVTLTVYSSGASTQSGLPALSASGGSSLPIPAIVGGAVGGVAMAVLLVIIWKHWGRVIKRTERLRRKEVEDLLTMRENTRRNATSGFRPQSQYRPMSALNRESRRVTFLMRASTSQQRPSTDNNNDNAAPLAPTQTEGEKGQNDSAVAPKSSVDIGSMDDIRKLSPNFSSSATPLLVPEAKPAGAAAAAAAGPERKSESEMRPLLLEREPEVGKSTEPITEPIPSSPSPPPRHTTPSPPPIPSSPTRATPEQAPSPSPTPSGSTSKQAATSRPSRSVRMRTPRRLPDPPTAPAAYMGRDHAEPQPHPASPESRASSLPRTSSIGSHRTFDSGVRSTSPTPLLPPVPPLPILPPAELSVSSWSRSPLRNSVLPSDNPVILPRPKNAPASQPVSPISTLGHLPSLSGSMSQSGESSKPPNSRFLGSLRRGGKRKSSAGTALVDQRPISTVSEASVYSTND